jgi:DNA-binding NarL/FixJ family response regulator
MRAILLSEPGWEVCGEATTGREALTLAHELKPDIIVLDLALPEMNGVEVTRQIRRTMSAAIVMVTMHDSDDVVKDAMEAGANGYVLKADAGRSLKDAVHAILSRGAYVSERVRGAAGLDGDGNVPKARRQNTGRLTAREREVLQLLAEGHANKQIAAALGITTKTAETHRARIMAKLDFHSITELVRYAIRNRIIEP